MAALNGWAVQLPAGTEVQIRLKSKIGSTVSRANDPVEAMVIAPVMAGEVYAIPAGAAVHGVVAQAQPASGDQRAVLLLLFKAVDVAGNPAKIDARVAAVDNARERVDERGQINGILASETAAGKVDAEVGKISDSLGGFGDVLSRATKAVTQRVDPEITYEAGLEMTLRLTAPVLLKTPGGPGPLGKLKPVADPETLATLAAAELFQTVAQKPPKNSDLTNLMLIGDKQQLQQAFADAGWHSASSRNRLAKFETVEALAEDKVYNEVPVSILLLDGKPPNIVFAMMPKKMAPPGAETHTTAILSAVKKPTSHS